MTTKANLNVGQARTRLANMTDPDALKTFRANCLKNNEFDLADEAFARLYEVTPYNAMKIFESGVGDVLRRLRRLNVPAAYSDAVIINKTPVTTYATEKGAPDPKTSLDKYPGREHVVVVYIERRTRAIEPDPKGPETAAYIATYGEVRAMKGVLRESLVPAHWALTRERLAELGIV